MLLVDLRWLLAALLLLLVVTALVAVWLDRWLYRQAHPVTAFEEAEGWAFVERLPFGVLLLDEGGFCRYANPAARWLLKLPAAPNPLPPALWAAQLEADRQEVRSQEGESGRFRTINTEGEQAVRWWVTAWGAWEVAVVQDATAQQRAEQGARFLISDLSHELRTPLATLLTHLEVLRLKHLPAETHEQSLHLMRAEAQRMTRMVQSVLDLGRLETSAEIEQRPVALWSLAEGVVAQVRSQAQEKGMVLSLEGDAPLPAVIGDADRLRQLLLILLDNALKYSRAGDEVTVRLTEAAHGVQCAVCDTGPGIAAEHLPHLTRRFYRANQGEGTPGSGLGLALAAEIARRHGGELEIESRSEGQATGTCVSFLLPTLGRP